MKNILILTALLVVMICGSLHAQEHFNELITKIQNGEIELATKTVVKVKLTENTINNQDFQLLNASGEVTGISDLDAISTKYAVVSWQRLFRPAGKFESRHRKHGLHLWYKITLQDEQQLIPLMQALHQNTSVSTVEPVLSKTSNALHISNSFTPDDPQFEHQWNLYNTGQTGGIPGSDINILPVWQQYQQYGDSSVIVSIHDGGIDVNHVDLKKNIWINTEEIPYNGIDDDNNGYIDDINGYNFADNNSIISPNEHATHVAGIIGASINNGIGVSGIAGGLNETPGVRLISSCIFGHYQSGGIEESYVYAADNGAVISQNSWGYTNTNTYEISVLNAIDYFIEEAGTDINGTQTGPIKGGLVFFSAGNEWIDSYYAKYYPACYAPVIAVTATDHSDIFADYSNFGIEIDISAPGGTDEAQVLSTFPEDTYGYAYGTSMASPHVSGAAALLISQLKDKHLTNNFIERLLLQNTTDIDTTNDAYLEGKIGSGRLNIFNSLEHISYEDLVLPITDLKATQNLRDITLSWSAPHYQASDTRVWTYDIRYDTFPITRKNFYYAKQISSNSLLPGKPGTTDNITIKMLNPNQTYYCAIRASDVSGNASEISNITKSHIDSFGVLNYNNSGYSLTINQSDTSLINFPLTLSNSGTAPLTIIFNNDLKHNFNHLSNKSTTKDTFIPEHHTVSYEINSITPLSSNSSFMQFFGNDHETFGYNWIDSRHSDGPEFKWIDISETGTELYIEELRSEIIKLPFNFPFYGEYYDTIFVNNPGTISFNEERAWTWHNTNFPDENTPNGMIAAFWDDVACETSGGTPGGRILYLADTDHIIVQYDNLPNWIFTGYNYTFQTILYKNGDIIFQYLDMDGVTSDATVGIESIDGTIGMPLVYENYFLEDSLSIKIFPSTYIKNITPDSTTILPNQTCNIELSISPSRLYSQTFYQQIHLNTDDPYNNEVNIPFKLTIRGTLETASNSDSIIFDHAYLGFTDSAEVKLTNTGITPHEIKLSTSDSIFQVQKTNLIIPGFTSTSLNIYCKPNNLGDLNETLTIIDKEDTSSFLNIPILANVTIPPILEITPNLLSYQTPKDTLFKASLSLLNTVFSTQLNWRAKIELPSDSLFNFKDNFETTTPTILTKVPITNIGDITIDSENGDIYICAGDYGSAFYKYSQINNQWINLNYPATNDSYSHNMVYKDGFIYLSETTNSDNSHLFIYNTKKNTWLKIEDPLKDNLSTRTKPICSNSDHIFTGIFNLKNKNLNLISYDTNEYNWEFLPSLSNIYTPISFFGTDENLLVINPIPSELYNISTYNFNSLSWTTLNFETPFESSDPHFFIPKTNKIYACNYFLYSYTPGDSSYTEEIPIFIDYDFDYIKYASYSGNRAVYFVSNDSLYKWPLKNYLYWCSVENSGGTINGTEHEELTITFDSHDLAPGTYYCQLIIESNTPTTPNIQIPISLTVTGNDNLRISNEQNTKADVQNITDGIRIFPNPASQTIEISTLDNGMYQYTLYNLNGALIKHAQFYPENGNTQLYIEDLPKGIYFLQISNNEYMITKKIIFE